MSGLARCFLSCSVTLSMFVLCPVFGFWSSSGMVSMTSGTCLPEWASTCPAAILTARTAQARSRVEHVFSSYPSILTAPAFTAVFEFEGMWWDHSPPQSTTCQSNQPSAGNLCSAMKELLHRVSRFDSVPGYGGSSTIEHAKNDDRLSNSFNSFTSRSRLLSEFVNPRFLVLWQCSRDEAVSYLAA